MNKRVISVLAILAAVIFSHASLAQQVILRGRAAVAVEAAERAGTQPAAEAQADIPEHLPRPSATQPSIPTPTADFELHEWAIFVAEPLAPKANAVAVIKSSMPSFVVSRRPDAGSDKRNELMPIGVIRIIGGAAPSPKFDVLLNVKGGEFQGHWPKAESRNNRLLWSNLIADEAKPTLSQTDAKNWLNRLRTGESRYLTSGRDQRGERCLIYDPEPNFTMPLKFETAGDSGYRASNSSSADIATLEIYKSKPDGWHKAFLETLPASSAAKAKPTTRAADDAAPKIAAGETVVISVENLRGGGATTSKTVKLPSSGSTTVPGGGGSVQLAGKTTEEAEQMITKIYTDRGDTVGKVTVKLQGKESAPTPAPATAPSGPATEMALDPKAVSDPKELLAAWKERLGATGLSPVDTDLILDILGTYAIDAGRLTAVYMLDRRQMDEMLPEEVVPVPAKTVRVGLVVVRNIDPQINEEIAALVKLLGDDEWAKREEAQKKLMSFGRAAKSAVEKAAKEKDLEIVWRAEAVLRSIDPQKFQPQLAN